MADKKLSQITDRFGPDHSPALSKDGQWLAYLGYDDKKLAHQANQLYVKNLRTAEIRALTATLDRQIDSFQWDADSAGIYIQYDDQGQGKIAFNPLKGSRKVLVENRSVVVHYSRPYTGGSFTVSDNDKIAYTRMSSQAPAELGLWQSGKTSALTQLNADLQMARDIGKVEEFWMRIIT